MYKEFLPIYRKFYDWRNFSNDNVNYIKTMINQVKQNVNLDIDQIECSKLWGDKPIDDNERIKIVRGKLIDAPTMIPIYSYRYMISGEESGLPIFSVHGNDIIYYGENLEKYLEIEFRGR